MQARIVEWLCPRAMVCLLLLWALLAPRLSQAADQTYVVHRGDTLFSIARAYALSPRALAERNGLSGSSHVSVGQRLFLPSKPHPAVAAKSAPPAGVHTPGLPPSVQRALNRAPVQPGRWKYIVIHHSGVDTGTVRSMDRYHREQRHMENGLAYHFVIGNGSGMGSGEIAVGRRWVAQLDGGHLASEDQNKVALGICLVGDFDTHKPGPNQMQSLRALVQALLARCHLPPSAVKVHQQINIRGTRCPGANFPTASFLSSLKPPAAADTKYAQQSE
ncbi:MAG TPA: N-acetylmuramoyl-L-alanine amidase [Bacillota bacterium]|nr:N-acetylmuramoyl-L-alanine amidase [Bacillota bacterium]